MGKCTLHWDPNANMEFPVVSRANRYTFLSVFTLVVLSFLGLLRLSWWQYQRYQEKKYLQEHLERNRSTSHTLQELSQVSLDWQDQRLHVEGRFSKGGILLDNRTFQGKPAMSFCVGFLPKVLGQLCWSIWDGFLPGILVKK